jgi:hypothetical protein
MVEAAEQYAALDTADDPVWSPYSEGTRRTVRALKIIGSKQAHPVMLAGLKHFTPHEMERLLRLLEILIVRYIVVGGGNPGRFETTCAIVARKIFAEGLTTAGQAMQEFRTVYPTDAQFQSAFQSKQERSNQKVQYLLRALEAEEIRLQKGAFAGELVPGNLTVEHVLPKAPGEGWSDVLAADPAVHEECLFRVGNMCLLTGINKELGSESFEVKKAVYATSDLIITKEIANVAEWNRKSIEHRQAHLAKLAAAVWRFQ